MINERWWMDNLYRKGWRAYLKKDLSKSIQDLRYIWRDKVIEETDRIVFLRDKTARELKYEN